MVRRASAVVVAFLALSLAACSERAAVASYFEEAQSLAERMVTVSTDFETLINAQEDPTKWSDESKVQLAQSLSDLRDLHDEAQGMSVPEAFVSVHPLLVQSLDEMAGAVAIIDEIAKDPAQATMERADEMTKKAQEGERLAGEYVSQLEKILAEKYPEMIEE